MIDCAILAVITHPNFIIKYQSTMHLEVIDVVVRVLGGWKRWAVL